MEKAREQGVWNRVAAPPVGRQSREELRILLLGSNELLGLLRMLLGKIPKGRDSLRQMQEWEQANVASLKGMLVFSGQEVNIPMGSPSPAPTKQALIRMYYLAKKAAAEYTARSVDPEFGVVYQEMAEREMRICNGVVQLLGELA